VLSTTALNDFIFPGSAGTVFSATILTAVCSGKPPLRGAIDFYLGKKISQKAAGLSYNRDLMNQYGRPLAVVIGVPNILFRFRESPLGKPLRDALTEWSSVPRAIARSRQSATLGLRDTTASRRSAMTTVTVFLNCRPPLSADLEV